MRIGRPVFACLLVLLFAWGSSPALAAAEPGWVKQVRVLAGSGAVMAARADGRTLLAVHPDRPLVPASILKIPTALAALTTLGPAYRFSTEFYLDADQDLYIVGRGDPDLVSEELAEIAGHLKAAGLDRVRDLRLDAGFFAPGLELDGTARSLNPYDAYNGALCVNFNTIFVSIGPNGRVASAEPQTPLTPLARRLALSSGQTGAVRLNLADSPDTALRYSGELFQVFLERAGVPVTGRIRPAALDPGRARLLYKHQSRTDLAGIVRQLLKYSNNFMANQVFLTLGAEQFGPPADADKARRAVAEALGSLGLPRLRLEEGSGLSRRTRMTASQMAAVLGRFRPYHELLESENGVWCKTGTLSGVRSLAGYFPGRDGLVAFVILLEGPQATPGARRRILTLLQENLD